MAQVDPIILQLIADNRQYRAELARTTRIVNDQLGRQQRQVAELERQIRSSSNAIGNTFKGLAATIAASFSTQQIIAYADSYKRFTNQLKTAGYAGQDLANVQDKLFAIAQRYGVELESVGTLYGRATAVSKELGASQAQLEQFTVGVAAALKIQGTSASESSGALLQLGQLLGSGRVQAEEFNSVLEGARPILVAVARNIQAAGGSVSKLKALVNDGKISNQQFFQAFLQGTMELEAQAAKSNSTIAQGFTSLNNAIGKYVGETDESLSVTDRIGKALQALAENLDKVALGLAIIAALLVSKFATGMIRAALSTNIVSASIFALQARALGAATSMEALAFAGSAAGRTLLAAFGGPLGLAVTALTLGIGYLVTANHNASKAADDLKASIDAQAESLGAVIVRQKQAAAETNNLTTEQRRVLTETAKLTGEVDLLATAWGRVAAQAKAAAIEQARAVLSTARKNMIDADNALQNRRQAAQANVNATYTSFGPGGVPAPAAARATAATKAVTAGAEERKLLAQAGLNYKAAQAELRRLESQPLADFKAKPAAAAPGDKKKNKGKQKQGKSAEQIEADFLAEMRRLQAEQLQAELEITTDAERRAEIMRQLDDLEYQDRRVRIEGNKEFSAKQKAAQIAELNKLYGRVEQGPEDQIVVQPPSPKQIAISRETAEKKADLDREELRSQQEALRAQAQLIDDRTARYQIEKRILELAQQEERSALESAIASGQIRDAQKARANLEVKQSAERGGLSRDYESPLAGYVRQINKTSGQLNDEMEKVAVDGLEQLNDQLVDAIMNSKSLGEVFSNVAKSIIADLLRIAIQQAIIKPLANSLFGGGESGGGGMGSFFGGLGGLFGGGKGGSGLGAFGATGAAGIKGRLGSLKSGIVAGDTPYVGSKSAFDFLGKGGLGALFGRASGGYVPPRGVVRVNEQRGSGVELLRMGNQGGKVIPLGQTRAASAGQGITIRQTVNVDTRGSVNPEGYAEHIKQAVRRETLGLVGEASRRTLQAVPGRVAQFQRDGT